MSTIRALFGTHHRQFDDRFAAVEQAVAAGIGKMTLNGSVDTEEFGIHQRFVAIVTDADVRAAGHHARLHFHVRRLAVHMADEFVGGASIRERNYTCL